MLHFNCVSRFGDSSVSIEKCVAVSLVSQRRKLRRLAGLLTIVFALGAPSLGLAQVASSDFRVTPVATAVTVGQSSAQSVINVVSSSIQSSLGSAMSSGIRTQKVGGLTPQGLSSGEASGLEGSGWMTGDYTNLRINPDGQRDERRLSDVYSLLAGGDVKVLDTVSTGVAFAYTQARTDGRNTNKTQLDQVMQTYTVTPYVGWSVTDHLMIDGLLGFSYSEIQTRDYSTGSVAKSSTQATNEFAAVNASYFIPLDAFTLKPFLGLSGQSSRNNAYRTYQDSNPHWTPQDVAGDHSVHWQLRAGTQLSYQVNDTISTYLSAAYERERHLRAIGENSARFSAGLETVLAQDLSLVVEGTANVGRDTQSDFGGSANLRLSF